MNTAHFVIEGPPVPKGRPRFDPRSGRAFTPKRTAQYERHVAASVRAQLMANGPLLWPLRDARYVVSLRIYFGTARWADADNCYKSVTDALNGVLWDDDMACDIGSVRRFQDHRRPRVELDVEVWR